MKNYYFSLILFLAICSSAILTNYIATSEINRYIASFTHFENIYNITADDNNKIAELKYNFDSKKNMLQLLVSKEHIHTVETNILLIENSIENNDITEIKTKSIESVAILNQIKEYLVTVY